MVDHNQFLMRRIAEKLLSAVAEHTSNVSANCTIL